MTTHAIRYPALPLTHRFSVYFLFFISGFCALTYEVVWSRMLVLVMGNTIFATTTILTVFMAGLSLGSLYWGTIVDKTRKNSLFLFGCLEAGIGMSALLVSQGIPVIIPVGTWVAHMAGLGDYSQMCLRVILCFAALFFPTFLIGGTLAVVGKHCITEDKFFAQDTAGLYGINTAGSFLGAGVTGFFLIKALGHNGSLLVAVLLNCIGGILAVWMSRSQENFPAPRTRPPQKKREARHRIGKPDGRGIQLLLLGLFISGFCATAYQILWTRLLILVIDNSVYSFTIILMAFLAGISLGSLLLNRLSRFVSSPVLLFALVEICVGITAFCFPLTIKLHPLAEAGTMYYTFLLSALPASILLPTLLMGIAFPLGARIYHQQKPDIGKSLGTVYFINTAGCVFGGLSAGFFLIGHLGFQKSIFLLTGLNLAIGSVIGLWHQKDKTRYVFLGLLLLLPYLGFKTMPADYFKKMYAGLEPKSKLIYYRESAATTATIFERPNRGKVLYLNGIPEVDTSRLSIKTFKLMGALPGLLQHDPGNGLMITFGAGISAGTASLFTRHLDCVDLASQAAEIAPYFELYNHKIKDNPSISLYNNDARHFLQNSKKQYSIITSDASHPRVYDSWVLFTSEFYHLVHQRLTADGIFLQWLPFHGLTKDQYLGIVHTFADAFEHPSLWSVGEGYSLLVATAQPLQIDFQDLQKKILKPAIKDDLHLVGLDNPFEILRYFAVGEQNMRKMVADNGGVMTDNSPAHLYFPIFSTFEDQYSRWPMANYQKVREFRESVTPYLFNISDSPERKEQLLNALQYYERTSRP